MSPEPRIKRIVGDLYSAIADNIYEPLVVQGAFRVFGAHLHETIKVRGLRAADLAAGEPILDMPVGTGFFTLDVARQHSGIVVGVDLAEGMVKETQRVAWESGIDNLEVARADAHRLPFADGSFAVVMCWNGLQVIPGTDETIAELARVLKPSGTLFASTVTLPLAVTPGAARHLPPLFQNRERFARSFEAAGLTVDSIETDRLASIFTATRPA